MAGHGLLGVLMRTHRRAACSARTHDPVWSRCMRPYMRNGGRHCCQPPLRRASDLPVFARLVPCGTRLRSWPTSSGVASRKTLLPHREPFSPAGRPTPSRGPILTAGSAIASARLPAEPRFGCPPSSRRCRLPVGRRHRRPDFGPGVGPATATECLPFRGPSWDDRSFQPHRPRPKAKPRMPHERDHLFRRLSPAMLPKVQRRSLPGVACLHRSSSGACRRRSGVLAASGLPLTLAGSGGFRPGLSPPIT